MEVKLVKYGKIIEMGDFAATFEYRCLVVPPTNDGSTITDSRGPVRFSGAEALKRRTRQDETAPSFKVDSDHPKPVTARSMVFLSGCLANFLVWSSMVSLFCEVLMRFYDF